MNRPQGFPVVLTADRTLMSSYKLLFDGMLAASQTSSTPPFLISALLMPGANSQVAPMGLRRIEAALLAGGFEREEVIVVDEKHLHEAIGPDTKIIGVTAGEPTGLGMNSSTMTGVAGGRIYPEVMFKRLIKAVRKQVKKSSSPAKIVMGGPGAWQLAADDESRAALGVDFVVTGYAEANVASIFRSIMAGDEMPCVIKGETPITENVPSIRGCSTMGVVEVSRGCGLGCDFCTIAGVPMIHIPEETIIADVRTNVEGGMAGVALLSEDFFRYGAEGMKVNPGRLISLLESLRKIEGLKLLQTDHANIYSISQFSDEELARVRELLVGDSGCEYPWVNIGIETASDALLRANGGAPKMSRVKPDEWGEFCAHHLRRLCNAGFMPMASLIIGLNGETTQDTQQTLDWVRSISNECITVFPMLNAPIDGSTPMTVRELTKLHWDLIKTCYKLNFKWTPVMYWDNQKAVGISTGRRMLLQVLGRGQVLQWNLLFAWHSVRAKK